jgi:hypothetical protein
MNDNVMDIICILVIPISNIIMFYVSFWWDLIRGSCPVVLTISHSIVKLKRQRSNFGPKMNLLKFPSVKVSEIL